MFALYPRNNPGYLAWFEDSFKFFGYWQTAGNDWGICMIVCIIPKQHGREKGINLCNRDLLKTE